VNSGGKKEYSILTWQTCHQGQALRHAAAGEYRVDKLRKGGVKTGIGLEPSTSREFLNQG